MGITHVFTYVPYICVKYKPWNGQFDVFYRLENWALSFGTSLWETARAATRFDAIQKVRKYCTEKLFHLFDLQILNFQRFHTEGAKIEEVDGFQMVTKMAANVEIMMQHKIDAIKVSFLKTHYVILSSLKLFFYLTGIFLKMFIVYLSLVRKRFYPDNIYVPKLKIPPLQIHAFCC